MAGRRAFDEILDGRPGAELVERRRAQLADEPPQVLDLVLDLRDGVVDRGAKSLRVLPAARRRQEHAQRAEALQRLVMQLPRPAAALALSRLERVAQALLLDRARSGDGGRRA